MTVFARAREIATRRSSLVIAGGIAAAVAFGPIAGVASPALAAPSASAEAEAVDSSVAAQLAYVREWWDKRNPAYPYIDDNDCVNFVNQSLIARGWQMTADWWVEKYGEGVWDWDASRTWTSSTALYKYLAQNPELAIALDDTQRHLVRLGDVIQFDWNPGEDTPDPDDRDHTGVVTKIEHRADGTIEIYYAGHTRDTLEQSITGAWERNGRVGLVSYWSIQTSDGR
jgi:hypothetical protein